MKNRTRSLTIGTAAAVAVGLSSALMFAAPASATPFSCGAGAVSLGGGVCQITYDSGTATFTPQAGTSKLEALLVGGGGDSAYGYGGGGGAVVVQNFTDTTDQIDITVGDADTDSTATQALTTYTAPAGDAGVFFDAGASGNGNSAAFTGGAGAGAGSTTADGGAGSIVSDIAPSGSLFAGDPDCYGGGGGVYDFEENVGTATCGGGTFSTTTSTAVPPVANFGGGAGSTNQNEDVNSGAAGVVVVRWLAAQASTVTFVMDGHGAQVPTQEVVTGTSAAEPPTPTATDAVFAGWYTDPGLTAKADFSAPITADTTFYASWTALAETGVSISPWAIPGASGVIVLGLALMFVARRRRRANNTGA